MTLVEGFDPDPVALARFLTLEGRDVTIAAPTDLDAGPGEHDEAFLDVWTPEVAPRVELLRATGCRVRSIADLVLERAHVPTIGVTGTAGKSTTAAFTASLLRTTGVTVHTSATARAGNLWPTTELLPPPEDGLVVLELTSSHLCFTTRSPTVAVITSFWPDHLELHGSLARYRTAKETIVRYQSEEDAVVANADDRGALELAVLSRGTPYHYSAAAEVERGAFRRGAELVLRDGRAESTQPLPDGLDGRTLPALLAAAATALAAGRTPAVLEPLPRLPHRAHVVAHRGRTELVDDGLAATPAKTAAALRERGDGSVVLIAGGERELDGREVHASPEELELLECACTEALRAARLAVCFGPAAARIAPLLGRAVVVGELDEAIATAARELVERDEALLVSPMFPLAQSVREQIAPLLARLRR